MAYDRDEFIRLLTDYYNFCNRAFWELTVDEAPPGGWSNINQQTLANLKRDDTVMDLLRHLPYVDHDYYGTCAPFIMDDTHIVNYRHEKIQTMIREGEIEGIAAPLTDQDPPIPPSCAAIAVTTSRNGYYVVLDTKDGYIYWGDPIGHDEPPVPLNSVLEQFEDDEANEWRSTCNVYEPADFFELCKKRFRELSWIGRGPTNIYAEPYNMGWEYRSEPDSDSDIEDHTRHSNKARLMKKVGWPGDGEGGGWDKAEFLRLYKQRFIVGRDETQRSTD